MRPEPGAVLLFMVLLCPLVEAALSLEYHPQSHVTLGATTPIPVTLTPGTGGTTTLGANATSAATTWQGSGKVKVNAEPLGILSTSGRSHVVTLALVHVEAPHRVRDLEIHLAPILESPVKQVEMQGGATVQESGPPMTLPAGGALTVQLQAQTRGAGSTIIHLEVRLHPESAPGTTVAYAYTLTLK